MKVKHEAHLSYCTNIHSGESWEAVFSSLQQYTLAVKEQLSADHPFGIGLRLSNESANELIQPKHIAAFKQWLRDQQLYVFTINGFPFGSFHGQPVKDQVHFPDWLSRERVNYTKNLFDLLAELLPEGMEGGISTSPGSYKYWYPTEKDRILAKKQSAAHFIEVVAHLVRLKRSTGKNMHLDIEPEPDGLLENSDDFIRFFEDDLLKEGLESLMQLLNCTAIEADAFIREHIQLCYDVCHFAVAFEDPETVLLKMKAHGIRIGKLQISAALKCKLSSAASRSELQQQLSQFDEPVYLHQAVLKDRKGDLLKFTDLKAGIAEMGRIDIDEIRTHFHVPIFLSAYGQLQSTQADIIKVLELWRKNPFTIHMEVETYTWDVLPAALRLNLTATIVRELNWVLDVISGKDLVEENDETIKIRAYATDGSY